MCYRFLVFLCFSTDLLVQLAELLQLLMKTYLTAVATEKEDVPGDHVLAVHHGCPRLEDVRAAEGGVCRPVARFPLHDRARLRQHHHRCVVVAPPLPAQAAHCKK